MSRWWMLLSCVGAVACHAKFKKAAPSLDAVRPQVVSVATSPNVVIGPSGNAVIDVVNGVRSIDVAERG